MKILVIGTGGREHALVWKLSSSASAGTVYTKVQAAAGRPKTEFVKQDLSKNDEIVHFSINNKIDLVVIGPEAPLSAGLADDLIKAGVKVFGPVKAAAMLETSKDYAKSFMRKWGIPTADSETFTDPALAKAHLKDASYPVVIKADGLAAGKGVRICCSQDEAEEAVSDFMEKQVFGAAGLSIIIEEFLEGRELSAMAVFGGDKYVMLPVSRDNKRLLDGNEGPNTGGMGAYTPVADATDAVINDIRSEVFDRVLAGFKHDHISYTGVLYAGIMLTKGGVSVLEFNVRFGDPETQVLMPMIDEDFAALAFAAASGNIPDEVKVKDGACVCVVVASEGYPDKPKTGFVIEGLEKIDGTECNVFHAGTMIADGKVYNAGGRVLGVSAWGADLKHARELAYSNIEEIKFEGMQYRKDIGEEQEQGD
ncbi:phosphoribosylamine--glycine ligase [Parelusimicrobium proximum]|uniref:phosphoribosylamine--glycine ligase n=1 Tax=Parelusimicrobium proximum TaxID=3228953 RepID=UPI003D16AFC5